MRLGIRGFQQRRALSLPSYSSETKRPNIIFCLRLWFVDEPKKKWQNDDMEKINFY